MMWRYVLASVAAVAVAQTPNLQVRANEVWLGQRQLTSDGKLKGEAVLSPAGTRVAYFEVCTESDKEACPPKVVILDVGGQRVQAFQVMTNDGPCFSISTIVWSSGNTIGADCHMNPSLGNYIETDLTSGKTVRNLFGYWFTPSPDGKHVAHVGPYPHFAPPPAHSNYLQIDKNTVYPLPRGAKPGEERPDVVRQVGNRWVGIHEFRPDFVWSPDSIRVAFIDCTYDWVAKSPQIPEDGTEMNNRCRVVVVSLTGRVEVVYSLPGDLKDVKIEWSSPGVLSVAGKLSKKLEIF